MIQVGHRSRFAPASGCRRSFALAGPENGHEPVRTVSSILPLAGEFFCPYHVLDSEGVIRGRLRRAQALRQSAVIPARHRARGRLCDRAVEPDRQLWRRSRRGRRRNFVRHRHLPADPPWENGAGQRSRRLQRFVLRRLPDAAGGGAATSRRLGRRQTIAGPPPGVAGHHPGRGRPARQIASIASTAPPRVT